MFECHPSFKAPDDANAKIWRYTDFAKLVSLLDGKALFFCRLDKLADPFEGSCPRDDVVNRAAKFAERVRNASDIGGSANASQMGNAAARGVSALTEAQRRWTAVNCWHVGEHESAAMWQLHLKSDEGIALQSTYQRLTDVLSASVEKVFVGLVQYLDYESDSIRDANALAPIVHKRRSFEHEHELRAVIWHAPDFPDGKTMQESASWEKGTWEDGLYVDVNVDRLIEAVYVAPTTPDWFHRLVQSMLGKFDLNVEVRRSELEKDPLF